MIQHTCQATWRMENHSYGRATSYGHGACGEPATTVRSVKAAHHDYDIAVYACDEHGREGAIPLAIDEPADKLEPVTVAVAVDVAPAGCPALAEPGNIHFMTAHCVDCNAYRMAKMTPASVEAWYHSGHFSQDEYEAYMHAWATSAVRHAAGGWAQAPTDPKVVAIVAAIRRHAGLPSPMELTA